MLRIYLYTLYNTRASWHIIARENRALHPTDTETQRHRHRATETQKHRDTETQRHRDTVTQRHRDTETQRHRDTDTDTDIDNDTHTHTHTHKHVRDIYLRSLVEATKPFWRNNLFMISSIFPTRAA